MKITINNQQHHFDETPSVETLMHQFFPEGNQNGMAVAVNQVVIPKKNWKRQRLQENDKVILIKATQGG